MQLALTFAGNKQMYAGSMFRFMAQPKCAIASCPWKLLSAAATDEQICSQGKPMGSFLVSHVAMPDDGTASGNV